jgi:predicted metal-dependent HD superfamily phosphohydrolase
MWYAPRVSTVTYLRSRWNLTLQRAEAQRISPCLIDEILEAYGEKGRYYHTKEHLRHMFKVYDRFFSNPSIVHELTFWYHDFYYDPTRQDNEDRSAALAQKRIEQDLKVPLGFSLRVRDLILFSHYTRPPVTRDEMVLNDIDLSIFGESIDLFEKYEKDIRQEYSFIPEIDYRRGRANILKRFIRDPFYFTPEMCYSSYEDLAQMNIRRSIDLLGTF